MTYKGNGTKVPSNLLLHIPIVSCEPRGALGGIFNNAQQIEVLSDSQQEADTNLPFMSLKNLLLLVSFSRQIVVS